MLGSEVFFVPGAIETVNNKAIPHHYDMIATYTADKGVFNGYGMSRREVSIEIKKFHEVELCLKHLDFPFVCPYLEQCKVLYNVSLSQEMMLFPDRKDWRVVKAFNKTLEKKSLCSVDANKVIQDEVRKVFFKKLKNKYAES